MENVTYASKHWENHNEATGDENSVSRAHVKSVPQKFVEKSAVVHHPYSYRHQHHGTYLQEIKIQTKTPEHDISLKDK